jgi:hypothetical protein
MDTVAIVLLVLGVIAIILVAKGKPLWSFLKQFDKKHPDIMTFLILAVLIVLVFVVSLLFQSI